MKLAASFGSRLPVADWIVAESTPAAAAAFCRPARQEAQSARAGAARPASRSARVKSLQIICSCYPKCRRFAAFAALWQGFPTTGERPMIIASVRFPLPQGTSLEDARKLYKQNLAAYENAPGLITKYYVSL